MTKIFEEIKDKKFLFFAAAASVVLTTAVFLFSYLAEKEKAAITAQPSVPREKTLEELTSDLTGKKNEATFKSFPSDDIKSLTAPVIYEDNLNTDGKNIKSKNPAQAPIPVEDLKSLTAPTK
jgi:hypothetical protein